MENDRDDIIVMQDEDGNEIEMFILDMVEYEGESYVLMQTLDFDDEDAYIFQYEEEGEDAVFNPVEDEELVTAVFDIFLDRFEQDWEEEDIEDEE